MKKIDVAAAVIYHEGRILATQRGYGEYKDGWEFPGGKIQPGETPQEALAREIREELDAVVKVGPLIGSVEHDYPSFHLFMQCFLCELVSDHFILIEHESARWLSSDELGLVDWLPADLKLLPRLRQVMSEQSRSARHFRT